MIEKVVLDYLTSAFAATQSSAAVPVYAEVPASPPGSYLVIEKLGGGRDDGLCRAVLAVQSVAPTLYGAAGLNERVLSAMDALPGSAAVYGCVLNSDYNFTDPGSKCYRYQALFELFY